MILIYGNDYIENCEEWNKSRPTAEDMKSVTIDYLQAYEFLYDDNLPEDWYDSAYWMIEE
jgi:hypothetical protein